MNATHTPGPWAYLGDHNRNTDRIVTHEGGEFGREQVALALDFNQFSRDGEADANARLIAAAPALLAALDVLLNSVDAVEIPAQGDGSKMAALYYAMEDARAALRLARGS